MLEQIKIKNILFLDIETVRIKDDFKDLDLILQNLWKEKTIRKREKRCSPAEHYSNKAGVMAEFAKIICISVGYLFKGKKGRCFRIKSFYGKEEKQILSNFNNLLSSEFNHQNHQLCAHNGKEFDFPFIARRTLINGLKLPKILDVSAKKPWEVNHLDTMELWRFGDYKNYTSIKLLSALFNIPRSNDDMNRDQLADVYYKEQNLEKIKIFCQKETLNVAQLLLRYKGEELIEEENIEFA
jgi:hypothetical protein